MDITQTTQYQELLHFCRENIAEVTARNWAKDRAKLTQVEQDRDRLAAEVELWEKRWIWQGETLSKLSGEQVNTAQKIIKFLFNQLTAAQEENKRLAGCLKASEKYAEGVKADFDKALNQLTTAQQSTQERRRIDEKDGTMTFACYLIDNCEGEIISEEKVQQWCSAALRELAIYEQGAEGFKWEVVNLIDAAVNSGALKDNYTFAAIRALPTQPEGERE